ncbi:polyamine ABC transporter substrate-binding protein [Shinella fusca]|uniref:Putrescine-binding periplasmic protein n=1 Tax=Shinella fusca TaxID=544480 RepID=A0A7W7YWW7_9HYPH|nr:polyamine ABC transporter substrate-binding protein [Shinella fusca]MBB5043756.1 putrescine transport system substrate-binding protein [Shinella fusca]
MIRRTLLATAAFCAFLGAGAAFAEDKVVNVYNWSDYIDSSIIDDFTKETGIKVVYDVYDSNEILETKLLAGGTGYDVVVPTNTFLQRQIAAGVYQKLDKSKLPNIKNMWDMVAERMQPFDPGNEYSINYMWGTIGIGFNKAKVKEALGTDQIDSWSVLLDPANAEKLKDCGINMLDSPTDIIPVVLAYLGLNPDSHEPDDIAKAEEALLKVRPFVRKFHSSEFINGLANGDICIAIGWSGDIFQARDRAEEANNGVELGYSIPKEGTQMWFDQMAIPADAPHVEEAHAFLNYIMRPEVIAKSTEYVHYANGNKASQALLPPDIINDPTIYPDEATLKKLFTNTTLDAKTQRLFTRTWTRVVTGQ